MLHRSIVGGLRRLLRRGVADRELDDEVAHYLEMATREHMHRGLSRADAERAARVEFGSVDNAKEVVRGGGWEAVIDSVLRDVRYAVRGLRRSPGFALAAALTLGLGIGVDTAMFSVVDGVMLRPLPYREANRLALIWTDDARRGLHEERSAWLTVGDWRAMSHTLSALAYFSAERATLSGAGPRERTRRAFVSGNLFSVLGVRPAVGRAISEQDERDAAPVVVISHALWQRRFAGDSNIVGRTVMLEETGKDGRTDFRIVGIMPAAFQFPDRQTELWMPATTYWRFAREGTERFPSWARRWVAVARMRDGVSITDVRAEFRAIDRRLTAAYGEGPADFPGFGVNLMPLLDSVAGPGLQSALWLLLGAVALVLAVACANVANLLLARGAARRHELALRRALGADRARLVRQLLIESLVLAALGGALGVALAVGGTRTIVLAAAAQLPRADQIGVDGPVLLFAVLVSVVSGVLFGISPALRASRLHAGDVLRDGGRTSTSGQSRRTGGLLIVVECASTIVLLVGAGLLLRSLDRLRSVDPGFDARDVLTVRIEFPPDPSRPSGSDPARARGREQMLNDLATRLLAVAGVQAAGFTDDMFITGRGNTAIAIPGKTLGTGELGELNDGAVTPGFFAALRVPLRAGRFLTRDDAFTKIHALWTPTRPGESLDDQARSRPAEPVVVNEAFVRRFFSSDDPVGKRFCVDPLTKPYWYEIVGVVGDMHRQGLERQPIPEYFGPYVPTPSGKSDLVVRTAGDPLALAPLVRQIVTSTVPDVLINSVSTADRELGQFTAQRMFQTWLLTSFAVLALVLAAIGVYGVVHYAVSERTQEIGIRMALGAQEEEVLGLVMREGMRAPALGILIGSAVAFAAARLMTHLLFGTTAADPLTYGVVVLTLGAVAACACYAPARRAASIDPLVALRHD